MPPEEEPTMQDLFTTFGVDPPEDAIPPETQEPTPDESEKPTETTEPTEPAEPAEPEKPAESTEQDSRASQAFAQMRVQNKQYESILKSIAGVLGVSDTNDPTQLTNALKEKVIDAQAKQQNIDPAILTRLQQLEERDQHYTQEEVRREAFLGFQRVKDQFGLDDKTLQAFANDLVQSGTNPFEERMDLVSAYVTKNYDNLIKAAEEKGIQKEAERAATANTHSTTPGKTVGQQQQTNQATKVNTVADLNKWINEQGATS